MAAFKTWKYQGQIILVLGCFLGIVYGQTINIGCPRGWVKSDTNRCYKFVEESPSIYEEADTACWKDGATLLTVNTNEEHEFISNWLVKNDILPPSQWLTSGYSANGMILWESENVMHSARLYWIQKLKSQEQGRIAYTFGGNQFSGYGWALVSDSDPLNFICEIALEDASNIGIEKRGEDYGYGLRHPEEIPRGPEITTQPNNVIVVEGSLSVYIECISSGNPYPSFTWFSGINANESITSGTDSRYTLSGGRFTIAEPRYDDVNSYRCLATNEIGTVMSKIAKIQFGYLREFPAQPDADVYASAFRGVRLECNTPSFFPEVRYEWSRFGTSGFVFPGHPYLFVSMAGYLYFSEVQPTDNKKYFCFVTLAAPNNYQLTTKQPPMKISLGIWLITSDETYVSNYGPIIYTHAFPSPALRGLRIRLECIAYGTLPLVYAWKRTDGQDFVTGTTISDRGRVLTIPNAPLNAEGGYLCTVTGKAGVANKTISVVMETEPYFPHGIGNMLMDPDQTVQWFCKAVARPRATYAWYKNGIPLKTVPGEIEVRGHMLYIRSVQKQRDEGMYQCGATNLHGTTFSTGRLKVVSFRPNFDKHPLPHNTLAPLGGTVTIPCQVEAAPTPQVSWLKNGGNLNLIPGASGRISMLITHELVLSEVVYSDAGTYTCEASNVNGEAVNRTYVSVVEGITITTPPSPTTVRVNSTAFLYCHAAYNSRYDVTYTWKFNGHPIEIDKSEYILSQNIGMSGLYISRVKYQNGGVYECVAETMLHSTSAHALLTVSGPPGPPAGVYADPLSVTPYSVRLVWSIGPGTDHGDPISYYDIEAETHYHPSVWQVIASNIPEFLTVQEAVNQGKRADQRTILVSNLIPSTGYRFRVRAVNLYGRGNEASYPSVIIQTPATAPVVSPRNVDGGGGKVGTLAIQWDPLDISEHCGPGLGYKIYWKLASDRRAKWKQASVTDERAHKILTNGGETKVTFTATEGTDFYYLQYEVKVGAYNIHGDGPNSTITIIYSAEGMPVATPKIQDGDGINSTAVELNWIPVPDDRENMKGRVRGYTVQYFEKTGDLKILEGYEPEFLNTKEVYGQTDHCLIIGLKPNSEYFTRVQVFNTAGRGPKGQWRIAETKNPAPSNYPTFVTVYPRTDHSVYVTWRGVSTTAEESSLLGYILRVWKIQEDIRTATDKTVHKVTETALDGLQTRTVYVLRIMGYSEGGDGKMSETVYFTVLGGNIPVDPTTSNICYHGDGMRECSDARAIRSLSLTVLLLFTFFHLSL